MLTTNLPAVYREISKAIDHITFALSTPETLTSVAQFIPQHEDKPTHLIDNIVYSEQILTETLQQLQKARRNLLLLQDGLIVVPKETNFDKETLIVCMAEKDGECSHRNCPQLTNRQSHCPLDV